MTRIALIGGRVIDPGNKLDAQYQVYIENSQIIAVAPKLADFAADVTIDATNCIICPGLIDLNANILASVNSMRSFERNLELAAKAGFTSVATHGFHADRCLSATEVSYYYALAAKAHAAKVYFVGPLTYDLQGQRLNELMLLKRAGCLGFSNGDRPIINTLIKKRCYEYAAMLASKLYISPEDSFLGQGGYMHEGEVSLRLGLPAIPRIAETLALSQELSLLEETGAQGHVGRLSSGQSVALLEQAQANKLGLSGDTSIYHLFLTAMDVHLDNGLCHVRPPVREELDKNKLREGIEKGIIKAICSDYTYVPRLMKQVPFQDSRPGIASWPSFLPLILRLVEEGQISLTTAIASVTTGPAEILGLESGKLSPGATADLVIFDPAKAYFLEEQELKEYGSNNPFAHWPLKGSVQYTIVNGKVVYGVF